MKKKWYANFPFIFLPLFFSLRKRNPLKAICKPSYICWLHFAFSFELRVFIIVAEDWVPYLYWMWLFVCSHREKKCRLPLAAILKCMILTCIIFCTNLYFMYYLMSIKPTYAIYLNSKMCVSEPHSQKEFPPKLEKILK